MYYGETMTTRRESRIDDIYNFECCCALLVSVLSPELCGPEVAFNRMGINCGYTPMLKEQYESFKALRKLRWSWKMIAGYFGVTAASAMSAYSRENLRRRRNGDK